MINAAVNVQPIIKIWCCVKPGFPPVIISCGNCSISFTTCAPIVITLLIIFFDWLDVDFFISTSVEKEFSYVLSIVTNYKAF